MAHGSLNLLSTAVVNGRLSAANAATVTASAAATLHATMLLRMTRPPMVLPRNRATLAHASPDPHALLGCEIQLLPRFHVERLVPCIQIANAGRAI